MTRAQKIELGAAFVLVLMLGTGALLLVQWEMRKAVSLQGAVVAQDTDPRKQLPIADVEVLAEDGLAMGTAKSDASGFFRLTLPKGGRRGQPITLHFRHPGYKSLDLKDFVGDKLYIAPMVPFASKPISAANQPQVKVGNLRVRYSIKTMTEVNIGSAVKTFEVENVGNV